MQRAPFLSAWHILCAAEKIYAQKLPDSMQAVRQFSG